LSVESLDTIRTIGGRICIGPAEAEHPSEPDPDFTMMRERFRTRLSGRLETLQAAWRDGLNAEGGLRTIKRLAHDLVGSAATFGFPELGDIAATLETAASRALLSPEEELGVMPPLVAFIAAIERDARKPLDG
jgi:HPt (histidine-containing phosphotransfer) domain-containing protein